MNLRLTCLLAGLILLSCGVDKRNKEGSIETHFSAQGGIEWVVEREIDASKHSIDAAVYSFTSRPLAQALVGAANRGVKVRIVMDPGNAGRDYSKATYLVNKGIEVRTEKGRGLMHHKFALIDDSVLITGSYNWTASAEAENDENILLLRGFSSIRKAYLNEFNRLWREARGWNAKPETFVQLSVIDLDALTKHVDEEVRIRGKVMRVGYSERSNTYFLDFSTDPEGFTVVIFSSVVEKFEGLGLKITDYEGAEVEVSGELIDHPEYGLEIILDEPSQVQIVK
ncbi:phospholipase D family protein [candidate division WOR-3 bacterium]|nr:phospholipase D family protein [candidate division WOR-3 bacterium]